MAEHDTLTRDKILDAAMDVLRRFGPQKANVVDVARALGVSHGSVYRHFASKAALRDAVVERWLAGVMEPLAAIAAEDGPAAERLRRWLDTLVATKRKRHLSTDRELFETYLALVKEAGLVIDHHIAGMVGHLEKIIADGVAEGEFKAADPQVAARSVLQATARFHTPVHAAEWSDPGIDDDYAAVCRLVFAGLRAGV